jgi:rhodanese-related sulfurtransferase
MKLLLLPIILLFSTSAYALNLSLVKEMIEIAERQVDVMSPYKLKEMIDEDEDFILIDIREPDQISRGEIFHIDNVRLTRGYLEFKIESKVPNQKSKIVVYCCSGKRSLLAAKRLRELGYRNVYSLEGGLQHWVEVGMPLDTAYGELIHMPETYNLPQEPKPAKKEKSKN